MITADRGGDETLDATRALAEVPYFDLKLAAEVVDKIALAHGSTPSELVRHLLGRGAIEPVKSLFSVPEWVRVASAGGRQKMGSEPASAIPAFLKHARRRLRPELEGILGASTYSLFMTCYEVAANPDDSKTVNNFVHHIYSAKQYGRPGDLTTANRILSRGLPTEHRLVLLTQGIELWNEGREESAVVLLAAIAADSELHDVVRGVSMQLVGLAHLKSRRFDFAQTYLAESVSIFKSANDIRGLSKAATSLARATRELAISTNDPGKLRESLKQFEYSVKVSNRLPDSLAYERLMGLGRADIGMSRTFLAMKAQVEAIESARSAINRFNHFPDQSLWARDNLAEIQFGIGRAYDAERTLASHVTASLGRGVEDKAVVASVLSLLRIYERRGYGRGASKLVERTLKLAARSGMEVEFAQLQLARGRLLRSELEKDGVPNLDRPSVRIGLKTARKTFKLFGMKDDAREARQIAKDLSILDG